MKIANFTLILILIFVVGHNSFAEELSELSELKKDPFLAGALSFYNPGLGQLYVGETEKGLMFWVGENTLFFSALLTVMDVSFKFKKDLGFEFKIEQKQNLSNERIYASIGLGIAFVLLHIYNIIDAVDSVGDYNKMLEEEYLGYNNFDFGFSGSPDNVEIFFMHQF